MCKVGSLKRHNATGGNEMSYLAVTKYEGQLIRRLHDEAEI